MSKNINDFVTIIIPTHNRLKLLKRNLIYLESFKIKIIVVDSGHNSKKYLISFKNIEYIYLKNYSFTKKIAVALDRVKTKYCTICPDDDFLFLSSIDSAVSFLEDNPHYSLAHGRYICFYKRFGYIFHNIRYRNRVNFDIDNESEKERMLKSLRLYTNVLYSLHRTHILKVSVNFAIKLSDYSLPELFEIFSSIISSLYGKHKSLPILWMAKDLKRYSNYSIIDKDSSISKKNTYVISNFDSFFNEDFILKFTEYLNDNYYTLKKNKLSSDFGKTLLENFINFVNLQNKRNHFLKKVLSNLYLKKIILKIYKKFNIIKILIISKKIKLKGFPWSDKLAYQEWLKVKKNI